MKFKTISPLQPIKFDREAAKQKLDNISAALWHIITKFGDRRPLGGAVINKDAF